MGMTLVETVTVGSGGAASIEFTSIPQDGVDLLCVFGFRSTTTNGGMAITLNNDSGSNYNSIRLYGQSGSVGSNSYTSYSYLQAQAADSNDTAGLFNNAHFYLSNYTSSSAKTLSSDDVGGVDGARLAIWAHNYTGTSPVTILKLAGAAAQNFAQYSTASLYKITAD